MEEESEEYKVNLFKGEKGQRYEEIGLIIKEFEQMSQIDMSYQQINDEYSNANHELIEIQETL